MNPYSRCLFAITTIHDPNPGTWSQHSNIGAGQRSERFDAKIGCAPQVTKRPADLQSGVQVARLRICFAKDDSG